MSKLQFSNCKNVIKLLITTHVKRRLSFTHAGTQTQWHIILYRLWTVIVIRSFEILSNLTPTPPPMTFTVIVQLFEHGDTCMRCFRICICAKVTKTMSREFETNCRRARQIRILKTFSDWKHLKARPPRERQWLYMLRMSRFPFCGWNTVDEMSGACTL